MRCVTREGAYGHGCFLYPSASIHRSVVLCNDDTSVSLSSANAIGCGPKKRDTT